MTSPELRSATRPSLLAQLMVLPPWVRMVTGVGIVGMAAVVLVNYGVSFYGALFLGFGALLGVPLSWSGVHDWREQHLERDERARAAAELSVLREELDGLREDKRGVERFLLERGYRSAKVRRWIALECGVVLPASAR
ncbi:MAG: hypothetical protein R3F29_13205 [Planctomycetota bacterium]